jgi:hypothetical protein
VSKPPLDTFYVAATTAAVGWAVYRKVQRPDPAPAGRVQVYLDADPTNQRISIPRGAIKITTHDRAQAGRAAVRLTVLDHAHADTLSALNSQHKLAVYDVIDRYNVSPRV